MTGGRLTAQYFEQERRARESMDAFKLYAASIGCQFVHDSIVATEAQAALLQEFRNKQGLTNPAAPE